MNWEEALKNRLSTFEWPEETVGSKALERAGGTAGITSVLVPLGWNRESGRDEILLMKRSQLVETHKGQISFPGGYHETTDPDLLHTALRELEEETGVKPQDVRVLGKLNPVTTRGSVRIYPWVGRMELPYRFSLSAAEVERLLFLPLAQLLDEGLKPLEVSVGAFKVQSIGLFTEGELVWGATARMLQELREVLLTLR